jgi:hypothetical protein
MHNHNDCGSFLLNINGEPALIEIGAPEYVRDFFRIETRYEFLAARSLGHSVPLVNSCEQPVGEQFAAKVLECKLGTDRVLFVLDLTKAYPAEAHCRKLVRTFIFEKSAGRLTVSDDYELDDKGIVESMLICHAPAKLEKGSGTISAPGGTLLLTPGKRTTVSKIDVCEYKAHGGILQKINRLRFRQTEPAQSGVLEYTIEVADKKA